MVFRDPVFNKNSYPVVIVVGVLVVRENNFQVKTFLPCYSSKFLVSDIHYHKLIKTKRMRNQFVLKSILKYNINNLNTDQLLLIDDSLFSLHKKNCFNPRIPAISPSGLDSPKR